MSDFVHFVNKKHRVDLVHFVKKSQGDLMHFGLKNVGEMCLHVVV